METSRRSPVRLGSHAARKARFLGVSDEEIASAYAAIDSAFDRGRAMRSTTDHVSTDDLEPPETTYVICVTFRTGSTLLKDWLASTGLLGRPHEHLNRVFLDQWSAALGEDELISYLRATAKYHQTPNRVFGTKIEFRQFLPVVLENAFEKAEIEPRLIYLERRDVLGQAISLVKAASTESWNSGESPRAKPEFDEAAILKALESITRARERWERYFALIAVEPLRLAYEDMIEDPIGTVHAVAQHVGVEMERLTEVPPSPLEIQRDRLNDEWADRIRARFAGGESSQ